jgi:hypothetical protein
VLKPHQHNISQVAIVFLSQNSPTPGMLCPSSFASSAQKVVYLTQFAKANEDREEDTRRASRRFIWQSQIGKVIQVRFLGPPWGDMESSNVAFLLSNVVLHPGCNSAEMNNHVMLGRFCLKSKHGRPFPFISSFPGR